MKKTRYILNGGTKPDDEIAGYRLICGSYAKDFELGNAVKVEVTNIELEKWGCDSYSTTDDNTLIKDLNPKCMVVLNGKWHEDKELTRKWLNGEILPHEFCDYFRDERNYKLDFNNHTWRT